LTVDALTVKIEIEYMAEARINLQSIAYFSAIKNLLTLLAVAIIANDIAILASFVNFLLPPLTQGRVGVG
jgi:hypothetical protein